MTDRDVQNRREMAMEYAKQLSKHGESLETVLGNAKKIEAYLEYGDWSPQQKSTP